VEYIHEPLVCVYCDCTNKYWSKGWTRLKTTSELSWFRWVS